MVTQGRLYARVICEWRASIWPPEIAQTKRLRRPLELSLEARYLAYAEKYAADYPELFPDATIKVAKDRLKALGVL